MAWPPRLVSDKGRLFSGATAATDNESFLIRLSYWPMVARHVLVHPFGIGLGWPSRVVPGSAPHRSPYRGTC